MIKFKDRYFTSSDSRGSIEGLIDFGPWHEINYITSRSDIKRGNHYHKKTLEAFFIISGKIIISLQQISNNKLKGKIETHIVSKGQFFIISPYTFHVFEVIENAEWLNFLSLKMTKKSPDIHRIMKKNDD